MTEQQVDYHASRIARLTNELLKPTPSYETVFEILRVQGVKATSEDIDAIYKATRKFLRDPA